MDEDASYSVYSLAAPGDKHDTESPPANLFADPAMAILSRQAASGLWESGAADDRSKSTAEHTVEALHALLRLDINASNPVYGAQIKKALDALLPALEGIGSRVRDPAAFLARAYAVAWLLASGRRTRQAVEAAARAAGASVVLTDERSVRATLDGQP